MNSSKTSKWLLKLLKWVLIPIVMVIVGVICYVVFLVETSGDKLQTEAEWQAFYTEINEADLLPENMYLAYDKVYPKALQSGFWQSMFQTLWKGQYILCPSRAISPWFNHDTEQVIIGNLHLNSAIIARRFEKNITQKNCLNYLFAKYDFGYGSTGRLIGAHDASHFYFRKPLKQLTQKEAIQLILISKNPTYYQREEGKKRLEEATNKILSQ